MNQVDPKVEADIWLVLGTCDLGALRAVTPSGYQWDGAECPDTARTPLQVVVDSVSGRSENYGTWVKIAEWLLAQGASPLQIAGPSAEEQEFWHRDLGKEKTSVKVVYAERSALSAACEIRQDLDDAEEDASDDVELDWSEEKGFLTKLIELFSKQPPKDASARMFVNTSVVDRWGAMLQDTSSHDLTIKAADGERTAHACMLAHASPVVKALLASCMQEASARSISLRDCPAAAIDFILELVYTGGRSEEYSAKVALHAVELAHRWQAEGIVHPLETYIIGLLSEDSFEEIASTSQVLNLACLKRQCVAFAEKSTAIKQKAKAGSLSQSVLELLGRTGTKAAAHPKKRRITMM